MILQISASTAPGCTGGMPGAGGASVVLLEMELEDIAALPAEGQTPSSGHRDRPLPLPVSLSANDDAALRIDVPAEIDVNTVRQSSA
jgi:hypothetical protein